MGEPLARHRIQHVTQEMPLEHGSPSGDLRHNEGMTSSDLPQAIDPQRIVWSGPASELAERDLVVLLHGYGSDARDLMNVVPQLPREPLYASLLAPAPCGSAPFGYEWFPLHFDAQGVVIDAHSPERLEAFAQAADEAGQGVIEWLDSLPTQPKSVSLLGFSQGGIVSFAALRRAPERFRTVAVQSTLIAPDVHGLDAEVARVKPSVWWGRGTADTVIPADAIPVTEAWMKACADAELHVDDGVGHVFSVEGLAHLAAHLRRRLNLESNISH